MDYVRGEIQVPHQGIELSSGTHSMTLSVRLKIEQSIAVLYKINNKQHETRYRAKCPKNTLACPLSTGKMGVMGSEEIQLQVSRQSS